MNNKPSHTLEEVLAAVEKGNTKVAAAHVLGVSFQTIQNYCKRWASVDEAFKAKRREMVSLAETGLRGAILRSEPWAVTFALRTLGKDEGYVERTEQTGANGGPIQIDDVGLSDDDRARRIAAILERARERRARQTHPDGEDLGTAPRPTE